MSEQLAGARARTASSKARTSALDVRSGSQGGHRNRPSASLTRAFSSNTCSGRRAAVERRADHARSRARSMGHASSTRVHHRRRAFRQQGHQQARRRSVRRRSLRRTRRPALTFVSAAGLGVDYLAVSFARDGNAIDELVICCVQRRGHSYLVAKIRDAARRLRESRSHHSGERCRHNTPAAICGDRGRVRRAHRTHEAHHRRDPSAQHACRDQRRHR